MRNYSVIHKCYSVNTNTIRDGNNKIFSRLLCREDDCPYNCRYLCLKHNAIDQDDARMLNDVREIINAK